MDYQESAKESLENFWLAKVEAAEVQYSENPCIETKAAYRSVLETFADLVLRGEAPEEGPTGQSESPDSERRETPKLFAGSALASTKGTGRLPPLFLTPIARASAFKQRRAWVMCRVGPASTEK
jgi:hypothetical protein